MIKINVRNVVVGGTVGMGVPIDVLSRLSGAMYDPTEFPGVRFRLNGCTVMIFGTGKVVVV
ncbi:MAG: TATA-box-binding protein, partial [Cenarchaeum sp. SB0667_bin_13]|nr:TATA-box-binding protein [Cenarchaeum sp. SB0667_bin_13]